MGMVIYNNTAAMFALHENRKNEKGLAKTLKQAASGMKLNSAADDASGYTISERMRIKLRALDQNDRNVKNGAAMLQTASGAVQEQVSLLKTIREKVIDANNDTNTEADRATIQKEIDQYYDQISEVVYNTEYNGEKILLGNAVSETVSSWEILNSAVLADDSEIAGLFPDLNFDSLDNEEGPFATFGKSTDDIAYDGYNITNENPTALEGASASNTNGKYLTGGTKGQSNVLEIDLSSYQLSELNNTSFRVNTPSTDYIFNLTMDMTNKYRGGEKIDISACSSVADVANVIKNTIASRLGNTYDVTSSGSKITLTTKEDGEKTNSTGNYNVLGAEFSGGTVKNDGRGSAQATGLPFGSFTGGKNEQGHWTYKPDPNDVDGPPIPDKWVVDSPATKAQVTVNGIDNVAAGSGFTLQNGYRGYTDSLVFKDDASGLTYDSANGYYTIGKNYSGNFSLAGFNCTLAGGKLTAESMYPGSSSNSSSFTDGVTAIPSSSTTYTATTKLDANHSGSLVNKKAGADGQTAHWDIDLSAYNTSDAAKAEDFIKAYLGKAVYMSGRSGYEYEFIDTGTSSGMDGLYKIANSRTIDLNEVRNGVAAGKTVAEAFSAVVVNELGTSYAQEITAADGTVTGVSFLADMPGENGNNRFMSVRSGELRHYTVDWKNWADTQGVTDIPAALHEKGLRFYCPTDASQWVNLRFVNGKSDIDNDRPASGNASSDIKTLTIDVSGIGSVEDLVKKIDTDLNNYLTNTYKHNLMVTSDPKTGTTTIYDSRRKTVMNGNYAGLQEKGAKIGNGVMDNVIKTTRNIYVDDRVIQHTDKSNMNIHIKIPQTTLDQIFGYKEGTHHISEYNVMTKDMREKLLGVPPDKGILDKGMDYLLDAQTLIGAQIVHMQIADDNIITQQENTTHSESVIRDADMAKTMMEYAKHNILSQASQSMLAQANQSSQGVLSLLQ